jgi:hypothetical protein
MALVAAVLVAWVPSQDTLSDEERRLVGRWAYQRDRHPGNLGLEYEFRADRTCCVRNFDPKTGALLVETTNTTWRLSGSALTVRYEEIKPRRFWRLRPEQRAMYEVSILAPDGPDRFRYTATGEPSAGQPPVTGTMTRVTP